MFQKEIKINDEKTEGEGRNRRWIWKLHSLWFPGKFLVGYLSGDSDRNMIWF